MEHVDTVLGHRSEKDSSLSEELIRRIDCAAKHWKETDVHAIMPCGGLIPGLKQTEAGALRDLLIARGVIKSIDYGRARQCLFEMKNNALHTLQTIIA